MYFKEQIMSVHTNNIVIYKTKKSGYRCECNITQAQSITTIVLSILVNEINEHSSIKDVALDFYIRSEQDIYLATKEHDYLFVEKLK